MCVLFRSAQGCARRDYIARLATALVVVVLACKRLGRQLAEGVDVELVVGEDDEILEVLGRRRGVVRQAMQRVIDARRGEGRQRQRLAKPGLVSAVHDGIVGDREVRHVEEVARSEEHTSELQSLMRISYAVFCLKKKKQDTK